MDCDGATPLCLRTGDIDASDADARLLGKAGDWARNALSGGGDSNGDGFDDIIVGAFHNGQVGTEAGAAYLLLGPVSGDRDLGSADARLLGEAAGEYAGTAVSGTGDVNRDGYDDILMAAVCHEAQGTKPGTTYVVLGPISGGFDLGNADVRLIGEVTGDSAGYAVSNAGDPDGDGIDGVLMGADQNDEAAPQAGAAHLFHLADW